MAIPALGRADDKNIAMPYLVTTTGVDTGLSRQTFDPGIGQREGQIINRGLPFTDENRLRLPMLLRVTFPKGKDLHCILGMNIGPYSFCRHLKEKIEELEPGTHEFFPLEVVRDGDWHRYGTYYLVHVTQKLDALVYEKTAFASPKARYGIEAAADSAHGLFRTMGKEFSCVLRNSVIEGRHLWRGKVPDEKYYIPGDPRYDVPPRDPMSEYYFVSDELGDFILREKLIGWDLHSCDVE
jgi:hypothetical protein